MIGRKKNFSSKKYIAHTLFNSSKNKALHLLNLILTLKMVTYLLEMLCIVNCIFKVSLLLSVKKSFSRKNAQFLQQCEVES